MGKDRLCISVFIGILISTFLISGYLLERQERCRECQYICYLEASLQRDE